MRFLFFQISAHAYRPLCGKNYPHRNAGEVWAAPDYKAMYFELFRASAQAAQLLQEAQQRAEEQLLEADLPPIRLDESKPSPSGTDSPVPGEVAYNARRGTGGLTRSGKPDEG